MTATKIAPLDYASAERKLTSMSLPGKDRQVLESTLRAIDEANDRRHLERVMAYAAGLLQGLAIGLVFKPEALADVGEIFEALGILRSSCSSSGTGRLRDAEKPDFQPLING